MDSKSKIESDDNTVVMDATIKSASYVNGDIIDGDFYFLDVELSDGDCECVIVDGESRFIKNAVLYNGGELCEDVDILAWIGKEIKVQKIPKYSGFRLKDSGDIAKLISEAEKSKEYGHLRQVVRNYYRPEQPPTIYRVDSGGSGKVGKHEG